MSLIAMRDNKSGRWHMFNHSIDLQKKNNFLYQYAPYFTFRAHHIELPG